MSTENQGRLVEENKVQDYVFRFAIEEPTEDVEPITFVGVVLKEILSVIELTYEGKAVHVDGFRLIADPTTLHSI